MTIDLEDFPAPIQFAYIAMTKSAIYFKEMKRDKDFFISFAEEIWNSMEMTKIEELKSILEGKMQKDIKPYVDEYMKKRKVDGI